MITVQRLQVSRAGQVEQLVIGIGLTGPVPAVAAYAPRGDCRDSREAREREKEKERDGERDEKPPFR